MTQAVIIGFIGFALFLSARKAFLRKCWRCGKLMDRRSDYCEECWTYQ